jgi:acyl-CoA reductase-like NAD-dependent aldehyde dehydrogenase
MISFTGSTGVGQHIGSVAGHGMKRLLLELGGKGAAIVLDDADLKTAIGAISSVWAFHSGQICTAPTRVLAQRGIYDQLVAGLQAAAGHMTVGDPLARETVVGPVITGAHRARIGSYIQAGRDEGGTIVTGGELTDVDGKGFFVQPTLIADCRSGMKVVQGFGPVISVVPFDDEDGSWRWPTPSSGSTTTCSQGRRQGVRHRAAAARSAIGINSSSGTTSCPSAASR